MCLASNDLVIQMSFQSGSFLPLSIETYLKMFYLDKVKQMPTYFHKETITYSEHIKILFNFCLFVFLILFFQVLLIQKPTWDLPHLLQLPENYNTVFQYYHRKSCFICSKVPKDPAVCLVCGAFVCLKGLCCKRQSFCECVLVRDS